LRYTLPVLYHSQAITPLQLQRDDAMTELRNPSEIADRGEQIYKEKYQATYEIEHPGQFVAIDVTTGNAFVGVSPEEVLENARKAAPTGIFHLIKVGSPGAFRVSYTRDANMDWVI